MAYRGPAGFLGALEESERPEDYERLPLEGAEDILCYVERAVLEWMGSTRPMPEGDYLFFAEGAGRLRFRILSKE
jgi:hypothetical protein